MDKTEHYLEKLHSEILDIMDIIHQMCEENNIRYFLIGGSLLGAIRHGGYIPWDDDLDIAMPRDDYERFLNIAGEQLVRPLKLVTYETDKSYIQPYAKVVKEGTLFRETPQSNMGIFVDIFPYDHNGGISSRLKFSRMVYRVLCDVPYPLSELKFKCKYLPSVFLKLFISKKKALLIADAIAKNMRRKGSSFYSNFPSAYKIIRETYPVEWFEKCKLAKFENRNYYVPENAERVLITVFGKNYMQLPPENLRKTHYPIEVLFSDGERIDFDTPTNIVKHEDIEAFADYN